jgi:hypothetical protein
LQRIDAREGPFQAVDGDPPLLQVHVGALQQPDLRGAQPVAVGQQEEGLIVLVLNDGQEAREFLWREKLLPAGAAPRVGYEWVLWDSHILDRIPVLSDLGK